MRVRGQTSRVLWAFLASVPEFLAFQATFRSDTRLVQINVVVHDKNHPVANLTREDFVLTDAGKPRGITVFSVVTARQSPGKAPPLSENVFSNRRHGDVTPPSITVILLDRLNTLTGSAAQPYEENATWVEDQALANARQHLIRFVAGLDPNDRVAIYRLGKSLTVLSDFTGDRERLHAVLEQDRSVSITSRESVEPRAIHTPVPGDFNQHVDADRRSFAALANRSRQETTVAALAAIAAHVADIPGRKNLVWLTANLPFSGAAAIEPLRRAQIAIYPVDARGLLPQAPPMDQEDVASRSLFGHNGVAAGQGPQPAGISTMEDLARETGGRAFVNTNSLDQAVRTAIEDGAVTYTLGFYPDAASLDGKYHELKVRVRSGNYEVRYPRGYLARRDAAANPNQLQEAIYTPLESSAIGLAARIDRNGKPAPDSLSVSGAIDLQDLELERSANLRTGAFDLYIVQEAATGGVLDRFHSRYRVRLTDRQYADYLKTGVLFHAAIAPKDGLATLRVLAADPHGAKIGSLIIPPAAFR